MHIGTVKGPQGGMVVVVLVAVGLVVVLVVVPTRAGAQSRNDFRGRNVYVAN